MRSITVLYSLKAMCDGLGIHITLIPISQSMSTLVRISSSVSLFPVLHITVTPLCAQTSTASRSTRAIFGSLTSAVTPLMRQIANTHEDRFERADRCELRQV